MADGLGAVNSIVLPSKARQTAVMKPAHSLWMAVVLLAACGPVSVYYKPGASHTVQKNDLLSCRVDALAKAPVASQIRRAPPQYIPRRSVCRADGRCTYRGGYFVDGDVYTVDVNAKLRADIEANCMRKKGYDPVELPRCNSNTAPAQTPEGTPALTGTSCVQQDDSGAWQIVDAAG